MLTPENRIGAVYGVALFGMGGNPCNPWPTADPIRMRRACTASELLSAALRHATADYNRRAFGVPRSR